MADPQDADGRDVLERLARTVIRLATAAPGGLTRLRLQSGEAAVELEWGDRVQVPPAAGDGQAVAQGHAQPNTHYLTAPMIGTFYRAPEPGSPPFVDEGDLVEPGQQIGILEAMKLMNPIEADRAGRVVEILVPDATPVQYDQPLLALVAAEGA